MVSPKNQNHKKRNTCSTVNEIVNKEKSHLFIDNVEGENTKTVEFLLSSSGADRVESAGSDCGENCAHWVRQVAPRHLVVAQVLDHLTPVPVITFSTFEPL